MKRKFFVIINKNGFVKATKTEGIVKPGEIQVETRLDIPDKAFTKPQFVANLTIREEQLPDIVQELEIEFSRIKKNEEKEPEVI